VAETTLGEDRLIVRRTRLVGSQASLWPDWRYHAFVTDRAGGATELDADHRRHAVCELAIRDLKDGAGLRHFPSGRFLANAAWLVLGALAHNLLRWTATIGLGACGQLVAKTFRRRLLALPGRLTRSARRRLLHLPRDWPWANQFLQALARLRAVPRPPDRQPATTADRLCASLSGALPPARYRRLQDPVEPASRPSRHRARRRPIWRASTTLTQTRTKEQQWIQA
jgi:hypothetical protein